MVMKRNAMRTNLRQSIIRSLGRYIAILAIIALGASMFVGLRMTKSDMVATGQKYVDEQNMFDLRLVSSYGWGRDQLRDIAGLDGITDAEGLFYMDLIAHMGDTADDAVYRFYSIPERINQLVLLEGRMPKAPNECLADGYQSDTSILGTEVILSDTNDQDSLDAVRTSRFTVVGRVSTPLYMDMNRGTTSIGSGSIANYLFVPGVVFDADYYTEIHLTIPGDHIIYSDSYNDLLEETADKLEPLVAPFAEERFLAMKEDAEEAYQEGYQEYLDGVRKFREGKQEAEQELKDARQELLDGEQELKDNEQLLKDGEKQIADGKVLLRESQVTLQKSRQTLASARSSAYKQIADANNTLFENYRTVNDNLSQVENGLIQIEMGAVELESGIAQLESGLSQLDSGIQMLETLVGILDTGIDTAQKTLEFAQNSGMADPEKMQEMEAKLQEQIAERDEYVAQLADLQTQRETYGAQLEELYATRNELDAQKKELEANKVILQDAKESIELGFAELVSQQLAMENQFSAAEAQIDAGEAQIEASWKELEAREQEIADGWIALEEGKQELADGWKEYEDAVIEVEQELADGEAELADAAEQLKDARRTIDGMKEYSLHILDRNTNVGYASLDSSSDIVAGVSKVFPVFFLLVAALVCITTMTRMVDEERTQIGTLKALGYSNWEIISKYMIYAGSSAVIGCGLGVLLGSVVFPMILWEAYKIMLFITPNIVLTFDIWLCLAVVAAYTIVMLGVTWYCCYRTLQEVPAELIRPKAPAAGKPLIFEKMAFWRKISFLNKVTIRNIFRYRQRLAMMLVGIGGCTALLLTGFGLRDSIVNIVDFQFQDITTYDMEVYFSEAQTGEDMDVFREELEPYTEDMMFYNQSSVEIDFDHQVREIYLITSDSDIQRFIDFHSGKKELTMPGLNEALLSVGTAETLGVDVGDSVILRNSDMDELRVIVSGIYYNHVYNYAIVTPETVEAQWGAEPERQMSFVKIKEGKDPHLVAAEIMGMDDVMNVNVSEDLADMVKGMMDALDLVVIVIVVCAGLLAGIVLYNLTNININERIREIATIKVLGFNAMETAMYIFKENIILSVFGASIGLLFGKLLLEFVMSEIKINMVWFLARAMPMSFIISVAMTILMALIVDFIFYFKLDRIHMAEALKSVE